MIYICILCDLTAQASWIRVKSPVTTDLRICCFTDEFNGWAAGDNGVIIHTSNGGNSFDIQNSTISFYISDIYFLNNRLGWVVANENFFSGTTILQTTNGGINWSGERFSDTTKYFRTIYFLDSLKGFMGGFGGAIYKTSNGGVSWLPTIVDSSEFSGFPISKIKFSSPSLGFACGGYTDVAGVIWRTTNGGDTWNAGNYSSEPFYDIYFKDSINAIAAGGDFEYGVQICKTSNAGVKWNYSSLGIFGQAYSIDFRTPKEAWMTLGYSRSWAVSYDSGSSWVSKYTADSVELHSVDFSDSLHGIAVGNNGAILKYVPDLVNITNINTSDVRSFKLFQNYPNPFNPVTKINYELTDTKYVSIIVYDNLGNKITELISAKFSPGSYSVNFNATNLPSGIYYYSLTAGSRSGSKDLTETKKMLLLK